MRPQRTSRSPGRQGARGHLRQAIEVYVERVDHLVDGGGNPAYAEAVRLVAHMAALRTADAQAAQVAALRGKAADEQY